MSAQRAQKNQQICWRKPACIDSRYLQRMPQFSKIEEIERYILELEAEIAHIGYQLESYEDGWLPNSCRSREDGEIWRENAISARALRWQQLIVCRFTIGNMALDRKYGS